MVRTQPAMIKKPRRSAKQTTRKKKPVAKKQAERKHSRPKALAAKPAQSSPPSHVPTQGLYGWITHTELSSFEPAATRDWCIRALGWTFRPAFAMPDGREYHLFAYSDKGGGGISKANPPDTPGSMPFVHVRDAQAAFDKAISEGAAQILAPTRVMEGVTIAIVRAPGGVPIGLSGP
jgi:uncharacterized protein